MTSSPQTPLARLGSVPIFLLLLLLAAAVGCNDDDFPDYNELEGLRVLAIQSEPPAIAPGETALLSALIFDEDGEDGDAEPLSYRWSWCPARAPAAAGAECLLDEQELADALGVAGSSEISFDLGEDATAELTHAVPVEVLDAICNPDAKGDTGGEGGEGGDGDGEGKAQQGFLLDCAQGLPISIKLVVGRGEQVVTTIKNVRLLLEAGEPETNPRIEGVRFGEVPNTEFRDGPFGNEEELGTDDTVPVAEDGSTQLELGRSFVLVAEVPGDASDRFFKPAEGFDTEGENKLENLFIAWFVSSGSIKDERTAFTDGVSKLADIEENTWRLPRPGDEDADSAELILVIRDERGGASWLRRSVRLGRGAELAR